MTAIGTGLVGLIVGPHGAAEPAAVVQPGVDVFQKVPRAHRGADGIDLELDDAELGLHDDADRQGRLRERERAGERQIHAVIEVRSRCTWRREAT